MEARLKSVAVWGGRFILLVALVFVAFEIRRHWNGISGWRPSASQVTLILALSVPYALSLLLLAEGWHRIVTLFASEPRSRTFTSFCITQVAKYLPGNVAHLIGRGLYLRGNTVSDGEIVKATLLELAVIPLGAAVTIVCLGSLGFFSDLLPWIPDMAWYGSALFLFCAAAFALVLPARAPGISGRQIAKVFPSVGLAAIFMLCLGGTFAAVFNLLSEAPVAILAGAGIIAWLVGYLTPGAPGGIGTREATLIALLSFLNQEDTVLIATALFRVVTTLGDVLLFAGSWLKVPRGASVGDTPHN
ncbi:hypothetical protein [Roseibium sp. MMSF_3412]|uniref:hypothetical protein n=1 Tax=Roseibium sp. MMSF_3412 TaxID=3046712 RepID=UPI00273FECEC|nr:hypothetical protein [Roseibium sp. MMSF_3412]